MNRKQFTLSIAAAALLAAFAPVQAGGDQARLDSDPSATPGSSAQSMEPAASSSESATDASAPSASSESDVSSGASGSADSSASTESGVSPESALQLGQEGPDADRAEPRY
jgi:hypothetical protein